MLFTDRNLRPTLHILYVYEQSHSSNSKPPNNFRFNTNIKSDRTTETNANPRNNCTMVFPPIISDKEQKRKDDRAVALAEFKYISEWRKQQGLGPVATPPPVSPSPDTEKPLSPGPEVSQKKESSPMKAIKKMKALLLSPRKEHVAKVTEEKEVEGTEDPASHGKEGCGGVMPPASVQAEGESHRGETEEDGDSEVEITALPPLPASPEQIDGKVKELGKDQKGV